jgi:long-chain acyl-CoA synthetase
VARQPSPPQDRPHLASLLEDFRRHGEQIAIVSRQGLRRQAMSYRDLSDLAARFARELDNRGIGKGDRVLIWGENGGDWVAAFFGCILRGVIAVPVDVSGNTSFAQRVIQEIAPKLATGSQKQLRRLDIAAPVIAFEDFLKDLPAIPAQPGQDIRNDLSEDDPVQIVFTSGTTDEPKGIVHTHRNILASLRPIEREIRKYLKYERIFHPLRFLHTLPLSHVFGQFMGIWIPVLLAAEVFFESNLSPRDMVETIRQERISVLAAVPRVLEMLQNYLLGHFPDLGARLGAARTYSAWRRWWVFRDVHRTLGIKFWALICGGATLPERLEQFWSSLGLVVVQGYGMTETAALVSLNHPFHLARGSIGKVLPGREIRLGGDGEILVRGETVSKAIWQAGRLHHITSDWFATGDLAKVDEAGNLTFRGRKKEVIVSASGLNIHPEDLEAALMRQPQIKAAAVVEVAGANGGEPLAALVLQNASDAGEAVRAANRELAEYQQIRRWIIWPDPDLPRTSTGKILRRDVAAALRRTAPADGAGSGGKAVEGGILAEIIRRITGKNIDRLSDSALLSEDLQLDSLGRVELHSVLETRFGVEIDEAEYQRARTLGELRNLLSRPAANVPAALSARADIEAESNGESKIARRGTEVIYPTWPWIHLQKAIRVLFIEVIMRPLVALMGNPEVRMDLDEEFVQPVLIVANHVSAYDVPLILYALPRKVRHRVAVAMAGEMLMQWREGRGQSNALLNMVAPVQYFLVTGLFNVFPLPQLGDFRKSFAHAGRAMDAGFHVLVFPEGRRTPDGRMQSFQAGAGLLWNELRTQALPVYLGGMTVNAEQNKVARSGRLSIRIGKLLPFSPDREAAESTRILESAVRELGDPTQYRETK